jgi:hypothetical protein
MTLIFDQLVPIAKGLSETFIPKHTNSPILHSATVAILYIIFSFLDECFMCQKGSNRSHAAPADLKLSVANHSSSKPISTTLLLLLFGVTYQPPMNQPIR